MYKRLLASTALVAAGVVGVSVGAQAQTAPAAAPLSVTVGGYIEQYFGYGKNKDGVNAAVAVDALSAGVTTVLAKPTRWFQGNDAEIQFNVKGTLANGITVGARVELEANTESDTIDESYMFIEGAFGRLELGTTDEAGAKTHVSVPSIGKAWGVEKGTMQDHIVVPANVNAGASQLRFTGINANEDQNNVSYYTPRFEGFQLGVTHTAGRHQDIDRPDDKTATRNGTWSGGINFTRNFSGFNVEASAAASHAKALDNAAAGSSAADKERAYAGGLRLGYAGFQVGGAYKKLKYGSFSSNTGKVWDVGIAYTFGPATVGLQYMKAEAEGATGAVTADDKFKHLNFGANYTLGPGVDLFGNIFSLKYTDESSTAAADNNKGSGAVAGLRLTF